MQKAQIIIQKGYQPGTVTFKQNEPAQLTFIQQDASDCLHEVKSDDLHFQIALNVGEQKEVPINTAQAGEFSFSCGMNMFHGKVIIAE